MNKNQKILTSIAIGLFIFTFLCAPWETRIGIYTFNGTAPLWVPPSGDGHTRLSVEILLVEWIGIGVLYAAFFFMFNQKTEPK
jgi:hypothetical protein